MTRYVSIAAAKREARQRRVGIALGLTLLAFEVHRKAPKPLKIALWVAAFLVVAWALSHLLWTALAAGLYVAWLTRHRARRWLELRRGSDIPF